MSDQMVFFRLDLTNLVALVWVKVRDLKIFLTRFKTFL
jgi:hypothetical protein